MKKIFTVLLTAFAVFGVKSQDVSISTYIERTNISPKIGSSISYHFADQTEVGGFYQKATISEEQESLRPLRSEIEFYGAYLAYPLIKGDKVSLKMNVRTGVSNRKNFAIVPGLMLNYRPVKVITIGGGVSTRSFQPTYLATIGFNIFRGSK